MLVRRWPIIFLLVSNTKANFTFLKTLGMQIDFLQRDLLYTLQLEIGTAAPVIFRLGAGQVLDKVFLLFAK